MLTINYRFHVVYRNQNSDYGIVDINFSEALSYIDSFFSVSENDRLVSLNGLVSLTTLENLIIMNNSALLNLSGLENLTAVSFMLLSSNDSLKTLSGLDNLSSAGNFQIKNNPSLISVAMDSLCHIEYYLRIYNNESLCSSNAYQLKDQILNCPSDEADGTISIDSNKICSQIR